MKNQIRAGDFIAVSLLAISLIVAAAAGRAYYMKEADYKASDQEYQKIESEYVKHPESGIPDISAPDTPAPASESQPEKAPDPLPIEPPVIDWAGLKSENEDIVGWIEIPAVGIQYPVLQGESNQDYLHQTVSGEWRTAGSIFLDSENSPSMTDKHSLIYGHNMRNGSMFASLKNFNDQGVYDSCPYFWVCTEQKNMLYRIVSVHVSETGDESYTLFPSSVKNKTFSDWVKKENEKSQIESPMPEKYIERLVTLSTCTPSSDNTRQLVQGILLREIKNN